MSVVKSKRSESKMEVILGAGQLAEYSIKICSNEKNFPKRYRWCITNKIIEAVVEINEQVCEANAVYMEGERQCLKLIDLKTKRLGNVTNVKA